MQSIIRPLSQKEHIEFLRLKLKSFPQTGGFDQTTIDTKLEEYDAMIDAGVVRTPQGLFRNNKLLGGMYFMDFKLNFHNKTVLMGGLGSVATDLLHKKEGIAREMVTYFLEYYDAKGAAIGALYAFRLDFYRKMGFGFGNKTNQYRIRPTALTRRNKDNLIYLEKTDLPMMVSCYNRYAKQHHGMITHTQGWWTKLTKKEYLTVGTIQNNQLKGYCTFEFIKGEHNPFWFDIQIHHLIYENKEAFSQLLGFLASQIDQAAFIIINTQDDDFHFLLDYPHNGRPYEIELHHQSNVQEVGICYRVLNVARVFEILADKNFGNINLKLKITVEDSFYPQNQGSTIIKFDNGYPTLLNNKVDFDVEITMDIAEFSSLIMGSISFQKLYYYDLAHISNNEYISIINQIFAADKPICISKF